MVKTKIQRCHDFPLNGGYRIKQGVGKNRVRLDSDDNIIFHWDNCTQSAQTVVKAMIIGRDFEEEV